jgi:hypothetical protein
MDDPPPFAPQAVTETSNDCGRKFTDLYRGYRKGSG